MKRRSKLIAAILISTLTVGSFVGCGSSSEKSNPGATSSGESTALEGKNVLSGDESSAANESVTNKREYKKEIHVAISAPPSNLDAMVNAAFLTRQLVGGGQVYEQLVTLDGDYNPQMELAESYEVSEDNKIWTYKLRQGVKFHDGSEMTAEDVVASINRWIDKVAVAKALFGDARFEVVDDYTVRVELVEGSSAVNTILAATSPSCVITTKEAIDTVKDDVLTEYIGTGPYKFSEWATDQYIKFEKFDDYVPYEEEGTFSGWWGHKTAYIDTIYYDIVKDNSTRVAGLQTGQYDMLYVPCPLDNFEQLKDTSGTTLIQENRGNFIMIYNKKGEAASNKVLRQAINKALDYDEVMTAAFVDSKYYTITPSVMYNEKSSYYTEAGTEAFNLNDPEGAKKMLEESGYDFSTPIKLLTPTDYPEYYNATLDIANQLEKIGLTVELESMDWASCLSAKAEESGWDAYVSTQSEVAVPAALPYLSGAKAFGFPDDETVISLQHDGLFAADEDTAKAKWEELQTYCLTDYVPFTSFGPWKSYSAIAGDYDMSFMQGGIMWNAKFYEE
ncbi:MAG: hypothetical protein GX284_01675 [Clostridiales bacterium]|nr:hypothetical protein [Clostridiales bacterium]